jgi:hypothetical protein
MNDRFHATTTHHCKSKCGDNKNVTESSTSTYLSEILEEEGEGEEEEEEENLRSYRTFHYSSRRNQEVVVQDRVPLFATIV